MSETHVNALKQDLTDALTEAKKAIGDVEAKVEAVLTKLDADSRDVSATNVVEAPAEPEEAPAKSAPSASKKPSK